jgi:hypothetical protein
MTGADVGERYDARSDRHLTASKTQDEFSAGPAPATHASRSSNFKLNPEATRFDRSQGSLPASLRHVEPQRQSV